MALCTEWNVLQVRIPQKQDSATVWSNLPGASLHSYTNQSLFMPPSIKSDFVTTSNTNIGLKPFESYQRPLHWNHRSIIQRRLRPVRSVWVKQYAQDAYYDNDAQKCQRRRMLRSQCA